MGWVLRIKKRERRRTRDDRLPNSKPTRPTPCGGVTEENMDAARAGKAVANEGEGGLNERGWRSE